jgi:hypothetical protein
MTGTGLLSSMLSVAPAALMGQVPAMTRGATSRIGFDPLLGARRARTAPAMADDIGAIGGAALLMIQAEPERGRPPRRSAREVAARALDQLGRLQRALLGGEEIAPEDLAAAAEEAEDMAETAPDAGLRRLCRAVALRLRVERAKLPAAALAG